MTPRPWHNWYWFGIVVVALYWGQSFRAVGKGYLEPVIGWDVVTAQCVLFAGALFMALSLNVRLVLEYRNEKRIDKIHEPKTIPFYNGERVMAMTYQQVVQAPQITDAMMLARTVLNQIQHNSVNLTEEYWIRSKIVGGKRIPGKMAPKSFKKCRDDFWTVGAFKRSGKGVTAKFDVDRIDVLELFAKGVTVEEIPPSPS